LAKRETERERENGDTTYRKKNVRTHVPTRKLVFKKETLENKEEDKEDEEDKEETISIIHRARIYFDDTFSLSLSVSLLKKM
jgi:hypothetical protein